MNKKVTQLKQVTGRILRKESIKNNVSPWQEIIQKTPSDLILNTQKTHKRILCATGVGSHAVVRVIDSLVAMGLYLRGAMPFFLLCDGILPACEASMFGNFNDLNEFIHYGPYKSLCPSCIKEGFSFYKPLPIPIHKYSEFISKDKVKEAIDITAHLSIYECFHYSFDGLAVGEQARAGVLRFFGKATFEDEDPAFVSAVSQRYLAGALVTAQVIKNAIKAIQPECVVAHHGVYVPQGVLGLVVRQEGIRLVNWGTSYRNTTAIYSHGDTYHHTFLYEPTTIWENRALSVSEKQKIKAYLRLRRDGKGDWSWVTPERGEKAIIEEQIRLRTELGLEVSKPTFGLLTNVLWDAQLYYGNLAFPDMLDWLFTTIDFFLVHPELQLLVRIHPHEVKSGNRQPTGPEIARRYPKLPENIKIVDKDSSYSTYALMDLCQAVLIYGTKTGVELAPYGQPVIVAGEAWIRGKGISYDASSRDAYFDLLKRLADIRPLSPEQVERALRYAYHYFFRRMIPFASIDPKGEFPPVIRIDSLKDLLPGCDPGLDVVCDGILTGKEFIYELV